MDSRNGIKKWSFQGNPELNASSISVRGVLNQLFENLDKEDKRPIIPLGRADPTAFPSYQTTRLAPDAVADATLSYNFNSYPPTLGVADARRYVEFIKPFNIILIYQTFIIIDNKFQISN